MENEVKIYYSPKKWIWFVLGCIAFTAAGIWMTTWPVSDILDRHDDPYLIRAVAYISIAFFGLGGLWTIGLIIVKWLFHSPYMTINDKGFSVHTTQKAEVLFEEVKLITFAKDNIKVIYFDEIEEKKQNDASFVKRWLRKFNISLIGYPEIYMLTGMSMSPEEISELIVQRYKNAHK